ncbi:MAG: Wzt carbohydrate-binding domain-containing protein, partial [Patescibacteria group bacterium]
LAFSVAAHLEPDILLIDEVLAVGDADFQKKCLGKMEEVTKKDGRTILFVSHNMGAIRQLCKKCILLEKGEIKMIGETNDIIKDYLDDNLIIGKSKVFIEPDLNKDVCFTKIWIIDVDGNLTNNIEVNQNFYICLEFDVNKPVNNVEISICLKNSLGNNIIFSSISDSFNKKLISFGKGRYQTTTFFKGNFLMPDNYNVLLAAHVIVTKRVDVHENVIKLVITENGSSTMAHYGKGGILWSSIISDAKWNFKKIEEDNL